MAEQNSIRQLNRIADQLQAIANWQMDHAGQETGTAKLLMESANWHRECLRHICGQGYFGCRGGENCDSDHK